MKNKINKRIIVISICVVSCLFLIISLINYCYDKFYYQPQQLYLAISNNNYETIKSLAKSGMDLNNYIYNITDSNNAFDEAYNIQSTSIAKKLIAYGIDVDVELKSGHNALFAATKLEDYQLCQMIINCGIDVYDTDDSNHTVLDYAILNHSKKMIDYYLKDYFTLEPTNIITSLGRDNNDTGELTSIEAIKTTRYLLEICKAQNIDSGLDDIFEYAYLGDSNKVIELTTEKTIFNLSTTDKHLLSYVCASYCNVDTLKKLASLDVDITYFNNYYIDSLRCATTYNSIDVVKFLANQCKDTTTRHQEKNINDTVITDTIALDIAIQRQDKNMFDLFLNNGCTVSSDTLSYYKNINNKDILQYLAKIIATTNDETIEETINECIQVNNSTALDILLDEIKPSILIDMSVGGSSTTMLNQNTVDVLNNHSLTIDYENMLITAIKNHDINMVKYTVSNLKDLDFGDDAETIPICVSITCGDMEIFDYLLENCASLDIKYSINQSIRNLTKTTNYSKEVKRHVRNTTIKKEGFFGWF